MFTLTVCYMKVTCVFLAFLCLIGNTLAQNLVPNNSFEEYGFCPEYVLSPHATLSAFIPPWKAASASPDYYNSCIINTSFDVITLTTPKTGNPVIGGVIPAKTGNAFAGMFCANKNNDGTNSSENIQVRLKSTLIENQTYRVGMFVRPSKRHKIHISNFGILLTEKEVSPIFNCASDCRIKSIPQIRNPIDRIIGDTSQWVLVEGFYTAQGNENYLTIGNFDKEEDMKRVDSRYIDSYPTSYYLFDEVFVYPVEATRIVNFYPNPFTDTAKLVFNRVIDEGKIEIYDVLGRLISQLHFLNKEEITISRNELAKGTYIIRAFNKDITLGRVKIIVL